MNDEEKNYQSDDYTLVAFDKDTSHTCICKEERMDVFNLTKSRRLVLLVYCKVNEVLKTENYSAAAN